MGDGPSGMLSLDDLADRAGQRRDRHRRHRLHRPPRPAVRQAVRGRLLPGRGGPRRHPRLRLPPDHRPGDGAGGRLPVRRVGPGLRRRPPRARTSPPCGSADWLDRSALVLCDVHHPRTHEPTAGGAAHGAARARSAPSPTRASRRWPPPSSSTSCSRRPTATPPGAGTRDLDPAGWYLEDYQLQQGTRTEPFHAAVRRHLRSRACPWRARRASGAWASTR